jgi:predicted Zn-dependent protease
MKRREILRWGCAHCALLAVAASRAGAQIPTTADGGAGTWTMPPRFAAPDLASEEGGLWAAMEREEQRLRRSPFLIRDEKLRAYLQGIACRLAEPHCPDTRVYPIRNAQFNANMAPNGMMQVWSGLLLRMDNEAQLAAVVAHEIGHFLQRHSLEKLRDAKARSAASILVAPFGLVGVVGQLALIASMFAYSRDQEREADTIGVQLMAAAGYDTTQASLVWANLLAEVAARPNADARQTSILFATHPPSEERRDELKRLARSGGETFEQTYRETMSPWQFALLEDELKRGQYEESIALLDRKIALSPERPDLRFFRAETRRLRAQGTDLDQALAELSEASRMQAAPPQTYRSLGLVLRTRNDRAGAADAFKRYLELAPAAPDAGIINSYLSELQS